MQAQTQTTPKINKGGYSIGVTCPGCGGKLKLDQDFFVLPCKHCGSVLRVQMPEVPPAFMVKGELSGGSFRGGSGAKKTGPSDDRIRC